MRVNIIISKSEIINHNNKFEQNVVRILGETSKAKLYFETTFGSRPIPKHPAAPEKKKVSVFLKSFNFIRNLTHSFLIS